MTQRGQRVSPSFFHPSLISHVAELVSGREGPTSLSSAGFVEFLTLEQGFIWQHKSPAQKARGDVTALPRSTDPAPTALQHKPPSPNSLWWPAGLSLTGQALPRLVCKAWGRAQLNRVQKGPTKTKKEVDLLRFNLPGANHLATDCCPACSELRTGHTGDNGHDTRWFYLTLGAQGSPLGNDTLSMGGR